MPSNPYVLSNEQLQYVGGGVPVRFRLYLAVFNPVAFHVSSQDIVANPTTGQFDSVPDSDLLALQVSPFAPQPNFGPNRIGFVGEPLVFDGSRSSQRHNLPALGHSWSTTGPATPTVETFASWYGAANAQARLTFPSPGLYTVMLTVRDRFGVSRTGVRQVMIYASRETAPLGIIGLTSLQASLGDGATTSVTVTRGAANSHGWLLPDALPVGTYLPVSLLVETSYEVAPGIWLPRTIGPQGDFVPGQPYDDPRVLFSGYVQTGTVSVDAQKDTVSFGLQTVDLVLKAANIHNVGYYNTTYKTWTTGQVPTSVNPSPLGVHGSLVADLTTEDLVHSLLGHHSDIGLTHDVFTWSDLLAVSPPWTVAAAPGISGKLPGYTPRVFAPTYSNITAVEGSIWDAIALAVSSEQGTISADRDGSIRVGPDLGTRGSDLMRIPTQYGRVYRGERYDQRHEIGAAAYFLNQPYYPLFLHGPNALPQPRDTPHQSDPRDLSGLLGPPILCHFSDTVSPDPGPTPPSTLFGWTPWPQDLSVRPETYQITERYSDRVSFVKLVATVAGSDTFWAAWFPQDTFSQAGLMKTNLGAGGWEVENDLVLADVSSTIDGKAKSRSWALLWALARRRYLGMNLPYAVTLTGGAWGFVRPGDAVHVSRQAGAVGPTIRAEPFLVSSLTYSFNLEAGQWTTSVQLVRAAAWDAPPDPGPPFPPPK